MPASRYSQEDTTKRENKCLVETCFIFFIYSGWRTIKIDVGDKVIGSILTRMCALHVYNPLSAVRAECLHMPSLTNGFVWSKEIEPPCLLTNVFSVDSQVKSSRKYRVFLPEFDVLSKSPCMVRKFVVEVSRSKRRVLFYSLI